MRERQGPQSLDQVAQPRPEEITPCTSVIVFNGDEFLAFRFGSGTTVGGEKVGIPGGHNNRNLETGGFEDDAITGPREVGEETDIFIDSDDLQSFEGDEFVHDMSKNGTPNWYRWKLYYTHEYRGQVKQMQPEEGEPEWMKIQAFFDLPDEEVAPNAKMALLYAIIDSANNNS